MIVESDGAGGYANPRISSPAEFSGIEIRLIGVECSATPAPMANVIIATSTAKNFFKFPEVVRRALI